MTNKDMVWRLRELPTVHEIVSLVADKIITPEEARKLLFNEQPTTVTTSTVGTKFTISPTTK